MRAKRSIIAALVAAGSVTAMAVPAAADPPPDTPPLYGGVTVTSDGLLPICLNVVRITVFGTTLVDVPKTCIG